MSNKSKKPVFRPGELDQTRKNLGELSQEESKKMAALLGGEVGFEQDDQALKEKYAKVRSQSRRRTDSPKSTSKNRTSANKGTPVEEPKGPRSGHSDKNRKSSSANPRFVINSERKKPAVAKEKPRYWARVRMNFLAASRDHKILTLGSALTTLLPSSEGNDRLNPEFVKEAEHYLISPLKQIKKGSTTLLTGGNKRGSLHRPHPYYRTILEILSQWQVESIEIELKRLSVQSKRIPINQCSSLCQATYSPFIRLMNQDDLAIESAVRHYFKLNLLNGMEKKRAKQAAMEVLNNYPLATKRLEFSYFPLLLKLSSTSFAKNDEFFSNQKRTYLPFLGLTESDIIKMNTPLPPVAPEELSESPMPNTPKEEPKPIPPSFTEGMRLLQEMFPQAGFEDLSAEPDLIPYFKPLLALPKNIELLPPHDPLQSIVIIMTILRELFFAFGSLKMGLLHTEEWSLDDIRHTFESYTLHWFQYMEDFLPKQILDPLQEYCREIEKGTADKSEYAQRLEHNIIRTKKILYLPHMQTFKSPFPRPVLGERQPKLYDLTDDLFSLLAAMDEDIKKTRKAVLNDDETIIFEVESMVSKRLISVIRKKEMTVTNSVLVKITAQITGVLNELLNNPSSFYYKAPITPIYRTLKGGTGPQYNVPGLKTEKLIKDWENRGSSQTDEKTPTVEANSPNQLKGDIELALEDLRLKKVESALMYLTPQGEAGGQLQALLIQNLRDDDSWYHRAKGGYAVLLRNTPPEGTVVLANRIQKSLRAAQEGETAAVGITPLQDDWDWTAATARAEKTLKESQKRNGGVIILFDAKGGRYRIFAPAKEGASDESVS